MAELETTDTEFVFDRGQVLEFRVSSDGERAVAVWNHGAVKVPLKRTNRAKAFFDRNGIQRQKRVHGIPQGDPWENMLIRGNALMNAVNRWYKHGGVELVDLVRHI